MSENKLLVIVLNGPNLSLAGTGFSDNDAETLEAINASLTDAADGLGCDIEFYQTEFEGGLIQQLHEARLKAVTRPVGVILNPGALCHYSYALADAVKASGVPCVEVHMDNIYGKEEVRGKSVTAQVCRGQIVGFGSFSYHLALAALAEAKNDSLQGMS